MFRCIAFNLCCVHVLLMFRRIAFCLVASHAWHCMMLLFPNFGSLCFACVESFALCHVALLWFYSLNLFCNVSFALHLILFFEQKCHRISKVNTSALASALLIASRMIFLFQFCCMVCHLCFPRHNMHQVIHCTSSIQVMNFLIMSFLKSNLSKRCCSVHRPRQLWCAVEAQSPRFPLVVR